MGDANTSQVRVLRLQFVVNYMVIRVQIKSNAAYIFKYNLYSVEK